MYPTGCLLVALMLLIIAPATVHPEKLSVLLPNQNAQFDLEHQPEVDQRSAGLSTRLSPPLDLPIPSISQLPLAGPPSPVPIEAPGSPDLRDGFITNSNDLQDRVPLVSGLYELPDETSSGSSSQGSCEPVTVTSRDVIVSTVVSQVTVPTTILQQVTTTQLQLQTAIQTSYVTLPPAVQTRTVTSFIPQTIYLTSTLIQDRVVTSTQYRVQTQVITSRLTQYLTETQTSVAYQTVLSTQIQPTYITSTYIQYVTPSCPAHVVPHHTTTGYEYTEPTTTSVHGGYGGYGYGSAGVYGPYYHASYVQPWRVRKLFKGKGFAG